MSPHSRDTVDTDPSSSRKIALLSDVHGNLPALEAVLADVDRAAPDEIWCLGDLVGYGAHPDECVALAAERCDLCLIGNHDLVVLGELDIREFSPNAATAARWTRDRIGPETIDFLGRLEPQRPDGAIGLYHASPRDPVWEYVLSTLQADACMDAMDARVAAIGHSHVALHFSRRDRKRVVGEQAPPGTEVDVSSGDWLINPGAVGQPRDGDPRAAWLLLDLAEWRASWKRVPYPIEDAATAIEEAGLPKSLADRLYQGQ